MTNWLWQWPADTIARLRRTAAGPAIIRIVAAVAAVAAELVSLPADVSLGHDSVLVVGVAILLAAAVGLYPRGRWTGGVALLCVGAWVVASVAYGDSPSLARVAALAGALYVMHAAAALAAVLPYDCVLPLGVLLRWAVRQGRLLATGLAAGIGGLVLVRTMNPAPSVGGAIVGALVGAALAGALAWQARRPAG
jgi:hypothetical protein